MRVNFSNAKYRREKLKKALFLAVFSMGWMTCAVLVMWVRNGNSALERYHFQVLGLKQEESALLSRIASIQTNEGKRRSQTLFHTLRVRDAHLMQFFRNFSTFSQHPLCLVSLDIAKNRIQYSGNVVNRERLHDFSERFQAARFFSSLVLDALTQRNERFFSFTFLGELNVRDDAVG